MQISYLFGVHGCKGWEVWTWLGLSPHGYPLFPAPLIKCPSLASTSRCHCCLLLSLICSPPAPWKDHPLESHVHTCSFRVLWVHVYCVYPLAQNLANPVQTSHRSWDLAGTLHGPSAPLVVCSASPYPAARCGGVGSLSCSRSCRGRPYR